MKLLVLNCGSATVKFKLFDAESSELSVIASGLVEVRDNHKKAIEEVLAELPYRPEAVGHRVVHGGELFNRPIRLDEKVLRQFSGLNSLAPLHNPPALEGIEAMRSLNVPQVAAFDTAFHRTMPERAERYAIPKEVGDTHSIRRYGFHGLSFQFLLKRYVELTGSENPNLVLLHLGNGASAAAVRSGRCIDTSMGLTPLEGLVMGSRPGDMDPAIIFYLHRCGMELEEIENMLWKNSGLAGLAGDNDMRALLARKDEDAELAKDIFCYRVRKYIGAYFAAIGEVEAIVFTGGIGQHSPELRSRILQGLEPLGIISDDESNEAGSLEITGKNSKIGIWVIPTDEEKMIAWLTLDTLVE